MHFVIKTSVTTHFFDYRACVLKLSSMDHSPIRQTSELGKFISTAGKSIVNLVEL